MYLCREKCEDYDMTLHKQKEEYEIPSQEPLLLET